MESWNLRLLSKDLWKPCFIYIFRFAITVWYFDKKERIKAKVRHQLNGKYFSQDCPSSQWSRERGTLNYPSSIRLTQIHPLLLSHTHGSAKTIFESGDTSSYVHSSAQVGSYASHSVCYWAIIDLTKIHLIRIYISINVPVTVTKLVCRCTWIPSISKLPPGKKFKKPPSEKNIFKRALWRKTV